MLFTDTGSNISVLGIHRLGTIYHRNLFLTLYVPWYPSLLIILVRIRLAAYSKKKKSSNSGLNKKKDLFLV